MARSAHTGSSLKQISLNETLSCIPKLLHSWEKNIKNSKPRQQTKKMLLFRGFSNLESLPQFQQTTCYRVEQAMPKCGQRFGFPSLFLP